MPEYHVQPTKTLALANHRCQDPAERGALYKSHGSGRLLTQSTMIHIVGRVGTLQHFRPWDSGTPCVRQPARITNLLPEKDLHIRLYSEFYFNYWGLPYKFIKYTVEEAVENPDCYRL